MPNRCCGVLGSSLRVNQKGLSGSLVDPPRHFAIVARVAAEGCLHINQTDGIEGLPEGARGSFRVGGTVSKFLIVWNFASTRPSFAAGGGR